MQYIPGECSLKVDQVRKRAGFSHFRQQLRATHIQHLRLGRERPPIEIVAAKDYVIDIHLLGDPVNGCA
jgi:hypothetical protein